MSVLRPSHASGKSSHVLRTAARIAGRRERFSSAPLVLGWGLGCPVYSGMSNPSMSPLPRGIVPPSSCFSFLSEISVALVWRLSLLRIPDRDCSHHGGNSSAIAISRVCCHSSRVRRWVLSPSRMLSHCSRVLFVWLALFLPRDRRRTASGPRSRPRGSHSAFIFSLDTRLACAISIRFSLFLELPDPPAVRIPRPGSALSHCILGFPALWSCRRRGAVGAVPPGNDLLPFIFGWYTSGEQADS